MSIAGRLRAVPWDVWAAAASVVVYAISLVLTVLSLQDGMFLCVLIALPMLAGSALALACRLFLSAANRHRKFALCLVSVGVLSFCCGSVPMCMRWHLERKVAMAGGADVLRKWAEGIMDECQPNQPDRRLAADEVPIGVRSHLAGSVTANTGAFAIHLGGGFFHYWVNFRRYPGQRPEISYDFD
ncbi:MAG: hypothetical protein JWP89_3094 [Schlesneria sp.]|nr:hypothetical protein [Schlesneria sp.]